MSPHRDRTGDLVETDVDDHHCDRGWLDPPDAAGRRWCPICKPWLRYGRPPTRVELARFEARHPKPVTTRRNP